MSVHDAAWTLDPTAVGCHEPPYHAVCARPMLYMAAPEAYVSFPGTIKVTLKLVQYVWIIGTGKYMVLH